MKLISVIVPVYKVEPYINKCIESIVNQTYKNLEIILVDDGSPDKSGEICDEWAKRDSRIKVVHQENGGGAKARNIGLDIATGDFIAFVDSDDYISKDMYSTLISEFTDNVDIVECEYVVTTTGDFNFENVNVNHYTQEYDNVIAMKEHILDVKFKQSLVNKLYKKEAIGDIRMTEGKKIDDEFFMYLVIGNSKKLIHCSDVLYVYRQQDNSVMHSMGIYNRLDAIEAKSIRHEYICKNLPSLKGISLENLWFSAIYLGQLALKEPKNVDTKNVWSILNEILCKNKLAYQQMEEIKFSHKVWMVMAKKSLKITCEIRNILGIGL